ncbi:MAG: 2Fe-2S iron-sulfur cluster-binding protein [Parvibaculaceae bacterium]
MIKITFIQSDGGRITADARKGMSVMEVAVQNKISGIDADCGGACACATCHVYVMPDGVDRSGDRNRTEQDMLSFAVDVRENSRLACQMQVTTALDGLVVIVPEKQF